MLSASLTFALLGALIKVVSSSLTNEMVVFFRNLCALIFIMPWLWYSRPRGGIKTSFFQLHLLRSIPLIAYVWLGEPVMRKVRGAIILGFFGIILILRPGIGIFQPIAFIGLGAGILAAFAMVSIRRMSASEPTIRIVFYFTVLGTLISAVPLIWSWQLPKPDIWWLLILVGLLAAVGQLLLTKGYSLAPAAQVGPFTYGNVVFATFLGWMYWGETLDSLTWAGAGLICIAGIITTYKTETHTLLGTTAAVTTQPAEERKHRTA